MINMIIPGSRSVVEVRQEVCIIAVAVTVCILPFCWIIGEGIGRSKKPVTIIHINDCGSNIVLITLFENYIVFIGSNFDRIIPFIIWYSPSD